MKNCIKSKKILWCSSFGIQALIYLAAMNTEKYINVINGVNGGKISEIHKLNVNPDNLALYDLFLDNVTGDLF